MMQSDRYLDESLPDFLLFVRRGPPHIFQYLVCVEELPLVEQRDPVNVIVFLCGHHQAPGKQNLAP